MVEDLSLRTVVQSLLALCETDLQPDAQWLADKDAATKIATNPDIHDLNRDSGFNFRYGGTYVSASRKTAVTYAQLYNCGSEALAHTFGLFKRLSQQRPALANREEFSRISALSQTNGAPLLVELRDVEVASLRAEQGGSSAPILERIANALNDPDIYDLVVQQENFELLQPVPATSLRFHKIIKRHSELFGDFDIERFYPPSQS